MGASNLASDLRLRAREVPDRPGLHSDDGRAWTFAELDREVDVVAAGLARLGVESGSRVATYMRNGPELAIALFACWRLGAVPVSVSGLYNRRELEQSLEKTQPMLVLVDDHDLEATGGVAGLGVTARAYGGTGPGLPPLEPGDPASVVPVSVEADAETVILFTGGTTGMPKAVSVTYGGLRTALERLARVSRGGRPGPYPAAAPDAPPNLLALPLFHSGGQHSLLFSFHVGRSAVVLGRFSIERLRELLVRHRFDNLFLLPTMLYDIVHAEDAPDLSSVRSVLVSGQALSVHLRRQFEERFRIPIVMNYGSTETGHVAGWTATDMKAGRWKPGSAGRVYDGVELEIRDDDGSVLPVGEVGEVCVRSAMPKGYVDDPGATGDLVQDGWVHSGDMGRLDEDGVLFIVGRKRDMIKTGGFQLWPEEIEEELRSHPLVRDVRVIGVPDDRLGEIPRALVVREPDPTVSDAALGDLLVTHCRERLSHYKAPREIVYLEELPRSKAGKTSRELLVDEGGPA